MTCPVSVPFHPVRRERHSQFTDENMRPIVLLKVCLCPSPGRRARQDAPFHPKTCLRSASLDLSTFSSVCSHWAPEGPGDSLRAGGGGETGSIGGTLPLLHTCCKVRPRDQDLNWPVNLAAVMSLEWGRGAGGVTSVLQVSALPQLGVQTSRCLAFKD